MPAAQRSINKNIIEIAPIPSNVFMNIPVAVSKPTTFFTGEDYS